MHTCLFTCFNFHLYISFSFRQFSFLFFSFLFFSFSSSFFGSLLCFDGQTTGRFLLT
ncbi:hypothetical protein L228DRAFT_94613 [Xylona heveae TC161]|uniref:Uncharacterized protein n=1 Tax=Xylona heveae (strain CBS 132557 / TC161) TaxID=1328760 RepID=A0A165I3P5_XYLHT|nr:hypothetical protein L228DRAFT_94613 [Xylona heveae TC161]KZF24333.1 hypothetical protein L228DRAFT_94613 [Xylona heveae TC161]